MTPKLEPVSLLFRVDARPTSGDALNFGEEQATIRPSLGHAGSAGDTFGVRGRPAERSVLAEGTGRNDMSFTDRFARFNSSGGPGCCGSAAERRMRLRPHGHTCTYPDAPSSGDSNLHAHCGRAVPGGVGCADQGGAGRRQGELYT